jgi:hypothetical protein
MPVGKLFKRAEYFVPRTNIKGRQERDQIGYVFGFARIVVELMLGPVRHDYATYELGAKSGVFRLFHSTQY